MLRKALVMFVSAALLLLGASGAAQAAGSQTWTLQDTPWSPGVTGATSSHVMDKSGSATGSISGLVVGDVVYFVADEKATVPIDFGDSAWTGNLEWSTSGLILNSGIELTLGKVKTDDSFEAASGADHSFAPDGSGTEAFSLEPTNPFTVAVDEYVALRVTVTTLTGSTQSFEIVTDGTSDLVSPTSDPGYPTPSLSSLILLGLGVVMVAGFVWTRRRGA